MTGRVFYCTLVDRKIVMLHQFVKKETDRTPPKELALARKRMKEWKNVDTYSSKLARRGSDGA